MFAAFSLFLRDPRLPIDIILAAMRCGVARGCGSGEENKRGCSGVAKRQTPATAARNARAGRDEQPEGESHATARGALVTVARRVALGSGGETPPEPTARHPRE